IYDINGKCIWTIKPSSSYLSLSIKDININFKGIYIINVTTDHDTVIKKIYIN
ncbi:MAG: T9SS type A sorting domain-containing protein, partial [Duncaniella sp.]|nr:T9SS type A sorting domain-containing protein [Duncaniella sp.]